ncbi:VWA domain-containing protein [Luteitalea sp.]|uniref:VWA domain-containing protein n=1 Tax=Luteitalea sp. TaxID=2004800 RepID=UPI0025BEE9A8|nr:VWA domain-containing protein [Luteitalea sp.]
MVASGIWLSGQAPPAFRGGVDLVNVDVTVRDGQQRLIRDLGRSDFTVFEDNRPQQVVHFQPIGVPLAVALLLDTSASMQESMAAAQQAAVGFVDALSERDVASVVDFDSKVEIVQDFTGDRQALHEAIGRVHAGGSTSLYNAVYIALRGLERQRAEPANLRRRAIVVLSDGEDTSSLLSFDEVLDTAVRSGIAIYAIGLGWRMSLPTVSAERPGQYDLRRLAQQTGGRAFFPQQSTELAALYRDILDELSHQYALAYQSTNTARDGRYRRIAVRVERGGVTVRARPGYYGPSR